MSKKHRPCAKQGNVYVADRFVELSRNLFDADGVKIYFAGFVILQSSRPLPKGISDIARQLKGKFRLLVVYSYAI